MEDLLLFANDTGYETRIDSYWSASARLHPLCIAQPSSTDEVSKVLTALLAAGNASWAIAVRGGGHTQWAGANNIDNGVTIDLGLMNDTTYDAATNLASVGPGGNWGQVYAALEPYEVTVVGGRDADVGISGYLLGGGNSYYTGRVGFGCDNVGNFEVVLTNGSVVNANNDTNSDLFKALKGGGSNFGIVTRFDLEALPYTDIYAGALTYSLNYTAEVVDAFVNFGNNIESHRADSTVLVIMYASSYGSEPFITSSAVNSEGQTNTTSFDEFLAIPAESTSMDLVSLYSYTVASEQVSGYRSTWFTLTFENDAATITKSIDLFNELVSTLKDTIGADDFKGELVLQPIPSYYAELGAAKGGNLLPLNSTTNSVLLLLEINSWTEENEEIIRSYGSSMAAEIQSYAETNGVNHDWIFLNYADSSQSPLASYSTENIEFIREVAAKYDPEGYFQTRIPGGFKISAV